MKTFIEKHHKALFYCTWLLLNLFLGSLSGLLDDEAYYWVYSRFLDWGYFDHPPMIALMIKAGYALFPNPFGLRLVTILMSTATLVMIDLLLEKRNDKLFYAIAASMFVFQIGGVITVPDLPLLFFTALFFLVYKKFILTLSHLHTIMLSLVMALMLYSKYHGVLIIFFTLLSNPRLLTRWQTWLAALITTVLFMPHLWWQFTHGWPSVYYHLFERNASHYKFAFTSEYLLGQIALAGPLIGWLLLFAFFRKRPQDQMEKTLRYTTIGIYAVFLLASFKGRVEANWTVPAFIGLIVLAHQYLAEKPGLQKWVYRLLWPTLALIMVVRVYMMADVVPAKWLKKDEFHQLKYWAAAIKDSAHGLPVVFLDSYQKPSQYWFWSNDTSYGLNTARYRRNNYNFWPLEKRLQGKRVYAVSDSGQEIITTRSNIPSRKIYGVVVDSFYSHAQVAITMKSDFRLKGKNLEQDLFISREQYSPNLNIVLVLYDGNNRIAYIVPATYTYRDSMGDICTASLEGVLPGTYTAKWGIESCFKGRPSLNSLGKSLAIN